VTEPAVDAGPYAHLAGQRLPDGEIELTPQMAWLWAHSVTAQPTREVGHPTTAWLLAMKGSGLSLDELFALVDATADSGVVLGESELEFHRVLHVGQRYIVRARILEVVRKVGRRSGPFDRMKLVLELHELPGDELAFQLTNTMVFPRGDPA
jgi:hypothetical protein